MSKTLIVLVKAVAMAPLAAVIVLLTASIVLGRVSGVQAMSVLSGSMEPAIPTGSVVLLVPVHAADVRVGDVITFTPPGRPDTQITHRVIGFRATTGPRQWVTQGDANATPDSWTIPAQGNGARVAASVPVLGSVIQFVQSPAFRIPVIGLPLMGLLIMLGIRISPRIRRLATA